MSTPRKAGLRVVHFIILIGIATIVRGLWMIYPPIAVVSLGLLLCWLGSVAMEAKDAEP